MHIELMGSPSYSLFIINANLLAIYYPPDKLIS